MIVDYINSHQGEFWIAMGFLLLAVEVLLMGLTTIVFMFAGLGALATGLLMMLGILPETWTAGISSLGLGSGISAALLWKPLKRLQGERVAKPDQSSDFVGLEFVCAQDITVQQAGSHRYSGVNWRVEIDHSAGVDRIAAGSRVKVTSLDVGVLRVTPV